MMVRCVRGVAFAVALLAVAGSARAEIDTIRIDRTEPFADELGMNQDARGRKVFDGLLAHIAGVGKVFHNHAFGQPGRTSTQHEDHFFPENWFPFAHTRQTDPLTGQTASLLRGDGFDPLIIESNTPTE